MTDIDIDIYIDNIDKLENKYDELIRSRNRYLSLHLKEGTLNRTYLGNRGRVTGDAVRQWQRGLE
jgi:hypothetical protein